jgi:carboxyl-terminal processing protease
MPRLVRPANLLFLGLVLGVGLGVLVERNRAARRNQAVTTAQVFQDVLAAIRQGYVDSLTDEELYAKAAKGVVSTLGDPYSAFLGPSEYGRYRALLRGRGHSVGLELVSGLTGLRVAAAAPRSPADRAGIASGDYLLSIDGQPSAGLPADKAEALLSAGADSVRIRFRTPGDSIATEVVIVPVDSRLPAASGPVRLTDSIGYVALGSVSTQASKELDAALDRLDAKKLAAVVLDLRGNGGGPLEEALAIADRFLAPGQRIGAMSSRRTRWAAYIAGQTNSYPSLGLVILVDRKTASSAEIIAAALRDNDRATLVGERTFGKGLVQTTIPLGDSAALRLTTGRWRGPGGRLITGGIAADSTVTVPPQEALLRRALRRQPEAFSLALERILQGRDSTRANERAIDSLTMTAAERDQLRAALYPVGITLSRRMVARHQLLFDRELRRVAALLAGDRERASRYGLLADPVVAAGVARAPRRP